MGSRVVWSKILLLYPWFIIFIFSYIVTICWYRISHIPFWPQTCHAARDYLKLLLPLYPPVDCQEYRQTLHALAPWVHYITAPSAHLSKLCNPFNHLFHQRKMWKMSFFFLQKSETKTSLHAKYPGFSSIVNTVFVSFLTSGFNQMLF